MKHLLAIIAFGVVGLGLAIADVHTDYDHSADFRNMKTYSWLKVDAGNSLWADRIRRDVNQQLMAKGLTMVPSGGDVSVSALGRVNEQQSYTTFYDGMGGGWGWRGFGDLGFSTTTPEETPVGTLTVDMFNSHDKKLIWRATSTKTLSGKPEKNEKKLETAVTEMFKKFPPKGE
jgi:hypothetical protein